MLANLSRNHQNITNPFWINQESIVAGFETENRQYTINQAADDVLCTVYNHIADDFEIFEAKVKTKSDSGLILTANRQLEVGTPILVRLKHTSDENVNDDLKVGIHTEVIHSKMIRDADKRNCYQLAIEYYESCH
jgi:hypothetical protein